MKCKAVMLRTKDGKFFKAIAKLPKGCRIETKAYMTEGRPRRKLEAVARKLDIELAWPKKEG
jgi:hypothetical protein